MVSQWSGRCQYLARPCPVRGRSIASLWSVYAWFVVISWSVSGQPMGSPWQAHGQSVISQ